MNKSLGSYLEWMQQEDTKMKNYEEVNEEVEEEEDKENKLWGRRNNNKVVSYATNTTNKNGYITTNNI